MLGLGETTGEILETLADLRSIGVDFLTLGQYLQPSAEHLAVARYLPAGGIRRHRAAGPVARVPRGGQRPFVRSSYHADEMAAHAIDA